MHLLLSAYINMLPRPGHIPFCLSLAVERPSAELSGLSLSLVYLWT